MFSLSRMAALGAAGAFALVAAAPASADPVMINVTIQNLAPTNSISFAPLRFGFNNGTFDSFDAGAVAGAGIVSVAEGGSGSAWLPAFAAADPTAVIGSSGGPLTPGATLDAGSFMVDTAVNPYFTFAAMVVPSNDFFIGNDDPMAYRLFDAMGMQQISFIDLSAADIWNAGSEIFDPLAAAFLAIGDNDLRTPENGVVGFNFAELAGFNGLLTAAGYTFDSNLQSDTAIYRIAFSVTPVTAPAVPEPSTWAMMIGGLGVAGAGLRRRAASRPVAAHA